MHIGIVIASIISSSILWYNIGKNAGVKETLKKVKQGVDDVLAAKPVETYKTRATCLTCRKGSNEHEFVVGIKPVNSKCPYCHSKTMMVY
jgi:Zn finger protein HypA/HybF involved in hydrogenase expression